MAKKLAITLLILGAIGSISIIWLASTTRITHAALAPGVTMTVNTAADNEDSIVGDGLCDTSDHHCSLRAALQELNANHNPEQLDVIHFNISNLFTLAPSTTYDISEPVAIDATTQPGTIVNSAPYPEPFNGTLTIQMSGENLTTSQPLFKVENTASGSTFKGLAMQYAHGGCLKLDHGTSDVNIQGNYFGSELSGLSKPYTTSLDDGLAISLDTNSGVHIGGGQPADRNLFAVLPQGAIYATATSNTAQNYIQGNYFGVGADGVTLMNNESGITLGAGANHFTIGGTTTEGNTIENADNNGIKLDLDANNNQISHNRLVNAGQANILSQGARDTRIDHNVISLAHDNGIMLADDTTSHTLSTGFTITSNDIGVLEDGSTALPNVHSGVYIAAGADNIIGGTNSGDANIIAANGSPGVSVGGGASATNNAILGNSIFNNSTTATGSNQNLGIDINLDGRSPTDSYDYDTGPNDQLNYPTNLTHLDSGSSTTLDYQLDVPAGDYRIEFYSNSTTGAQGKTFLASQNITSSGSGNQSYAFTLSGTPSNITATTTEIKPSKPSGFGSTSEFSNQAVLPASDIGITATAADISHVKPGGSITYNYKLINNGPQSFDLNTLNGSGSGPFTTALLVDFLPSDLTPSNVNTTTGVVPTSDPNVACQWYGYNSGSLAPFMTNHQDSSFLLCYYTGGSTQLANGRALSIDIGFTISNSSNLAFSNYALTMGDPIEIDSTVIGAALNSADIIDYLSLQQNSVNNFSRVPPAADIGLTKVLVDPEDVATGQTISYDITLTNHGPQAIELSEYASEAGEQFLFSDVMPPDVSFVTTPTSNVQCFDLGPGSSVYLGPLGQDHSLYQLVLCVFTGQSTVLSAGQSFTTRLNTVVNSNHGSHFTNYAINSYLGDTDVAALTDLLSAGADVLDTASVNNLARASYPIPIATSMPTATPVSQSKGSLVGTGENWVLIAIFALIMMNTSVSVLVVRHKVLKKDFN